MQIQNLYQQLRCPIGKDAVAIGEIMSESNKQMIQNTINKISWPENANVLEIGPGNGKHVSTILNTSKNLQYAGVEISAEMYNESIDNNTDHIESDQASFRLYDGVVLPYDDENFDIILTVNTIYFWENPEDFLEEIKRVVSRHGIICVTFLHEETTQSQDFLGPSFQHFSYNKFLDLVHKCDLKTRSYSLCKESVINKIGQHLDREYGIYQLMRK